MLLPLLRLLQPVLTSILEYTGLLDKNKDAWCSTCMSLGYLYERGHNQPRRPSPIVLRDRSFDDFSKSADRGCPFCDVVLQSFALLDFVAPEMRVKLLLDAESPAELHGSGWADFSEVIEIYPCPGKLVRPARSFLRLFVTKQSYREHASLIPDSRKRRFKLFEFARVGEFS